MTSLLFKGLGMKTLNLSLAATFMLKRLFNAQLVHKRRLCCLISWHLAHINGPLLLLGRTKFTIKLSGAVLCYCCARGFYLNTGPLALGIGYLRMSFPKHVRKRRFTKLKPSRSNSSSTKTTVSTQALLIHVHTLHSSEPS
jgi:hypothetical protein